MNNPIQLVPIDLLRRLDAELLALLRGLSAAEWNARTPAGAWTVKDVAAHLLDGNLRTLSMLRDGYFGEAGPGGDGYTELVEYLNRLNREWIIATRRLSPGVLLDWLAQSGREYCDYLASLEPGAPAAFPVVWAGESESVNGFHIAREYTEKWHHQMQIRHAVGQTAPLLAEAYYVPYLETSLRGLPHHYRNVPAGKGESIRIGIVGPREKVWYLQRGEQGWILRKQIDGPPTSEARIPDEIAWRLFTKGIDPAAARAASEIRGKTSLALPVFELVAVMA